MNHPPVITIDSWYVHHSQPWVVYGIVIPTLYHTADTPESPTLPHKPTNAVNEQYIYTYIDTHTYGYVASYLIWVVYHYFTHTTSLSLGK